MPLPLSVCCLSKILISFTFLVPAHPDSPGEKAVKQVYVRVYGTGYSASILWHLWFGFRNYILPIKPHFTNSHWFFSRSSGGEWVKADPVVGFWRGYLSGARCRFAYAPADATATHCLLLLWNPDWFYHFGTSHPGSPGQRAVKRVCVIASEARIGSFIDASFH